VLADTLHCDRFLDLTTMRHTHNETHAHPPRALRALELCVGAGGLALGVSRAGFNEVTAVDVHGAACETLRANKKRGVAHVRDWNIVEADIRECDFSEYAAIDLISGGPPCQPFSQGGKRHGRSDSRELFPEFVRAVREVRPKAFVFENVKGLRYSLFLRYFNYVLLQLQFPNLERRKGEKWMEHRARLERAATGGKRSDAAYKVIWQVLNAANFGVGQRRERVFIVGVRSDLDIEYAFPLPTHHRNVLWYDQWVTGSYWERHEIARRQRPLAPPGLERALPGLKRPRGRAWLTVRDSINDLPNVGLGRTSHTVHNHFFNPGAREYAGHSGSSLDAPAKTIKAGHHGVPGGENMIRLDDGQVRYFSVRECARLQTFPDAWAFDGAWCSCMNQIGNAVPVTLSEVVVTPLASALRAL
jgi:DNA (cytosine-5)-methyltransferase 1